MEIRRDDKQYPLVSICTCVYNGEKTLHRVFESMSKVTYPNIEHIIVNDGSTDKTEELIEKYAAKAKFPVKHYRIEHSGKHSALNIAWDMACGDFVADLDADDEVLPHSINYLVDTYFSIPNNIRDEYWCVHGRSVTQNGDFIGDRFPTDINHSDWRSAQVRASQCQGNKFGLRVKKYLSEYRFPNVIGAHYLPESIVWKQLNSKYGTWYTNEVVHIYYVNEGGNLSARRTKRAQFGSLAYYYKWCIMHPEHYRRSIKDFGFYSLCFFVSSKKYRQNNKYLEGIENFSYKALLVCIYPVMYFLSILFRILRHIK